MKLVKCFTLLLFLGTAFVACKKDHDTKNPTPPSSSAFVGKWIGKYGYSTEEPTIYFSLNVKADGVIQELNKSGVAKGEGTYTVQDNTLKGTYKMKFSPFNQYSVSVIVSSSGKMEGTWGYDDNGSDGGKILLEKQ